MSFSATPAYVGVSAFYQSVMAFETKRYLQHLYTRIPIVPIIDPTNGQEVLDDWGLPSYSQPTTYPNQPCQFYYKIRTIVTPYGVTNLNVPTLVIAPEDPLAEGDQVSNIVTIPDPDTGAQVVLLTGPMFVEKVYPQDPQYGTSIYNEASLRDMKVVPNSTPT